MQDEAKTKSQLIDDLNEMRSKNLLRDAAADQLGKSSDATHDLKEKTPGEIIHELQVHQIELELQNEELRRVELKLEGVKKERDLETPIIESPVRVGTETILLVDDEESIKDLGATLLTNFGYKVITANDGKEALEIYRAEKDKIALILLDLIMPVMDGKQCLAEVLQIDPNAKVVIASGNSEDGQPNGATPAGAKGFVQKPFNIRQLLTTIREVLDEAPHFQVS
jgi:CheY-like chemotaxis protein